MQIQAVTVLYVSLHAKCQYIAILGSCRSSASLNCQRYGRDCYYFPYLSLIFSLFRPIYATATPAYNYRFRQLKLIRLIVGGRCVTPVNETSILFHPDHTFIAILIVSIRIRPIQPNDSTAICIFDLYTRLIAIPTQRWSVSPRTRLSCCGKSSHSTCATES